MYAVTPNQGEIQTTSAGGLWGAYLMTVAHFYKELAEFVYRAEHRIKSKREWPGLSPSPPGAGLGREAAKTRRLPVLPPPPRTKTKNPCDCIGVTVKTTAATMTERTRHRPHDDHDDDDRTITRRRQQ